MAQKYDADLVALHASPKIISSEYYEHDDIRTNKSVLGGGIAELPRRETEENPLARLKKCKQNNVRSGNQ